jgi:serine protease Do
MKNWIGIFFTAVVACLLTLMVVSWYGSNFPWGKDQSFSVIEGGKKVSYTDALLAGKWGAPFGSAAPTHFIKAAQASTHSVVNISGINHSTYGFWNNEYENSSTGSGVIVSPDGYIITNNHVIEESDKIEVTLNDKREYSAKLIGRDPSTDIALLKIEGKNFPFMVFGNSDSLQVGEWVLAVGNPFNLSSTVTAGIISAKGRNINILSGNYTVESFIQTDAVVNPGNSGGALVNTRGQLVGINSAIVTESGRYEGYSFAVPSNLAQKVISDLKNYGEIRRGILGVEVRDVTDRIAKELNLENIDGVIVKEVTQGGGAELAGIKPGDILLSINNIPVHTTNALQEQIAIQLPDAKIEAEIFRNGSKFKKIIQLKNLNPVGLNKTGNVFQLYGFELRNLSKSELRKTNGKRGAYVFSVTEGGVLDGTNLQPGFIITEINGKSINNVDEAVAIISEQKNKISISGIYDGYTGEYNYDFRSKK